MECEQNHHTGCSMSKVCRNPIGSSTDTRSSKYVGRASVGLSDRKRVPSLQVKRVRVHDDEDIRGSQTKAHSRALGQWSKNFIAF